MSKKLKPLYEFTVDRSEVVDERKDNPDGSFTITKVTKKIPHKFCIKTPSRQDRDHAELFYFARMNEASKMGLVNEAVLIKRLNDNGGLISENEKKLLLQHQAEIADKTKELETAKEAEVKDEAMIKALELQLEILVKDLQTYSNTYGRLEASVLESSAESWVRNKIVRYYLLNLLHKEVSGGWENYFSGASYESRLDSYYEIDDQGENIDPFVEEIIKEGYLAVAYWVANGTVSKEALDKLKKDTSDPAPTS